MPHTENSRDKDRAKVYAVEATWERKHRKLLTRVPVATLKVLIRYYWPQFFKLVKKPIPELIICSRLTGSEYRPSTHVIALAENQQDVAALCHELAHAVIYARNPRLPHHCPEWRAVYLKLLYSGLDTEASKDLETRFEKAGLSCAYITSV